MDYRRDLVTLLSEFDISRCSLIGKPSNRLFTLERETYEV